MSLVINYDKLTDDQKVLIQALEVKSNSNFGAGKGKYIPPKYITCYISIGRNIFVPLNYARVCFPALIEEPKAEKREVDFTGKLDPEQYEVAREALAHLLESRTVTLNCR